MLRLFRHSCALLLFASLQAQHSFAEPLDDHPNSRYTLIESVPGTLYDFSDVALLHSSGEGTEIRYRDGRPSVTIPVSSPFITSLTSFLTPNGAVVLDERLTPSAFEYSGTHKTYPGIKDVRHSGDFGVFIAENPAQSFLRNFAADTNLAIAPGLFSADVSSNGIVYLSTFNSPDKSSTTLNKLETGEFTQIAPETNHIHGRIQTDGTNVLYFTAPFTVDSNGFQIYLHTPAGRVQLATNYVPPFASWIKERSLSLINNGWALFPRMDSNGIQQVWRRAPDGTITQATFFSHHTVPFTLRSDGAFVAHVFEQQWFFGNYLFLIRPDAPPVNLGLRYATDFRFVRDELIAFYEGYAFRVDITHPNPIRLYLPRVTSNSFSVTVAASTNTAFIFEHSADLRSWSAVSTNLTATANPAKFDFAAPPGFIRTRQ